MLTMDRVEYLGDPDFSHFHYGGSSISTEVTTNLQRPMRQNTSQPRAFRFQDHLMSGAMIIVTFSELHS